MGEYGAHVRQDSEVGRRRGEWVSVFTDGEGLEFSRCCITGGGEGYSSRVDQERRKLGAILGAVCRHTNRGSIEEWTKRMSRTATCVHIERKRRVSTAPT